MIHSSGSSGRQWRLLASAIERAGGAAIAPDLTGSGANPPIPHGQPVDVDADLQIALDAIDSAAGPVDLIGHSYGGWLALRAALARPGRIRQVLVHEPVLWGVLFEGGDPKIVAGFEALGTDDLFHAERFAGTETWWHRFIDFWNGAGTWGRLPDRDRERYRLVGWKVFHEVRALIDDPTGVAVWADLGCPLRISVGQDSPAAEREVVRILGERLVDGEVREIPGGHMAPLTHARPFVRLYAEWLGL